MSRLGVYVSEAARLSLRQGRLVVGDKGGVPLEDVNYIVLDTRQTTLTGALLAACADMGCAVITADERHMPNGVLLGFHPYHRQAETVQAQLNLSQPRKKRLWQQLIRAKIVNQSLCLRLADCPPAQAEKVHVCAAKVRSGDMGNMEATAARLYWSLYAPDFRRHAAEEDRLNSLLNYGYAVLRALLARDLAALGFVACLGIHHHGLHNPFNLADDLLEPWRPFVDHVALSLWREQPHAADLSPGDKQRLISLTHQDVLYDGGVCGLLAAMRQYVGRVRAYMVGQTEQALCPAFSLAKGRLCPPKESDTCV